MSKPRPPGPPRSLRVVGWGAWIAMFAFCCLDSSAARTPPSWVVRSWTTANGLPQNTVSAIVQTRDGYLWLGTRDGLARFDGVRFTVFGLPDGLQSVEILALHEDHEGNLWIGTSGGGLARHRNGRIETLPNQVRRTGGDIITALAEDDQGQLWVGTRAGLRLVQTNQIVEATALGELARFSIRSLLRDRQGGLWISAASGGLYYYHQEQLTYHTGPPPNEHINAYRLWEDRRGWLWASVGNGRVLCRQQNEWRVYAETNGLPFAYVTTLLEDAEGMIWAGSLDEGLYYFADDHFHGLHQGDGLSADDITALYLDREANIWVGTRTGGLNRLNRRRLLPIGPAQGLTNLYTRSMAESADGTLWVGTTGGGLYRGSLAQLESFRPPPLGGYYAHVDSVLAARDGSIWWGGANALIRWQTNQPLEYYTNTTAWLQSAAVTALCEDATGGIWVGTSESRLAYYRNGSFTEYPRRVARGAVTALAPEPDGAIWIGSVAGGLRQIHPHRDTILVVTNGLLSQSIRTLYRDPEGDLWIGTTGGGLSRRQTNGHVVAFPAASGLNLRTISQIVEDDLGRLWLGGSQGILQVRKADLRAWASGKLTYVHTRSYGGNDGMPAEECTGGFSPAGLKTRSGLVGFATGRGLVFVNPAEQPTTAKAPDCRVEEIQVGGKPQLIPTLAAPAETPSGPVALARLTIPPGDRDVEIYYTGIHFSAPDKLNFRYRLEGVDLDWVNAGPRRTAFYGALKPGRYTFQVMACSPEGNWSAPTPPVALTVLPFFYETSWFRGGLGILSLVGIVGTFWLVLRRRYRRRLARLQLQNAIQRERLRISQDMHDHVGAMLTQVSQLSDMGQGEAAAQSPARHRFERIGTQARNAVQALDEIVWATNPSNDNLPNFVEYVSRFTDEFFESSPIRCWQQIPVQLPALPLRADVRHDLFLAIKEACHNVLKHSHATEVRIRVESEQAELVIEVEDNGRGFDPGATKSGDGLRNMRTRLTEAGGFTQITSSPDGGTRIRFRLKLPANS